jgi:hypothetical protein
VNRLWSRVGVRATSVGLLALGVAGGVYLGHGSQVQPRSAEAQLVAQSDAQSDSYEMQLLKQRQSNHAAARAWQRQAESDAAARAAAAAKAAASKAQALEKKAIAKRVAEERAAVAKKATVSTRSAPYTGPIPSSCSGDYSGNKAIGCSLMLDAGFGIDQFPCLDKLWTRESHWNTQAANPSGAYGIPQALPGSKMAAYGDDWRTSAATQIKWGLNYIEGRYKTPCAAWSHSQSTGWY